MTDPEALPDADLSVWPIDDFGWDWDEPGVDREPERSAPPWYRSPGPLLALISAAAATLVVAAALVIVGSGEIPIRPALGTKAVPTDAPGPIRAVPTTEPTTEPTTASTTAPTTGESGPSTPASASASASTSASAEEAPTEEESPAPAEDVEPDAGEPAAAVPPAQLPVDSPGTVAGNDSDGPRINVTRSPMSFSPGSSANG